MPKVGLSGWGDGASRTRGWDRVWSGPGQGLLCWERGGSAQLVAPAGCARQVRAGVVLTELVPCVRLPERRF
eukprot:3546483-Rhodomonas_salina.2